MEQHGNPRLSRNGSALLLLSACVLGTAGLLMIGEGLTNAGIEDVKHLPQMAACKLGIGQKTEMPVGA